jgi:glycine betaine/proline transport system ATP-binding protein
MTPEIDDRPVKLACRNLWKIFGPDPRGILTAMNGAAGDRTVLKQRLHQSGHLAAAIDVNFDIRLGEIFVIMGLSGSGKSTLVRCLSRLIEPTMGEILLDGEDLLTVSKARLIELRRRAMGMVFQNFGLLPHLTVRDNVAFPLRIQGMSETERLSRAKDMIDLVGLNGKEAAFPHQLSGGQQQRVGIARSLAVGPELWFLDEPFSALDPLIRRQMQDEFLRLQRMLQKTIIFITHDIAEAFRLADRIAIMRDGEVIQLGRPADIALQPANDYVADFTEEISLTRVISVADVMTPAGNDVAGGSVKPVSARLMLEELVPQLAAGVSAFPVVDEDDRLLGQVAAADIVDILERDRLRRRRA